MWSSNVPAEHHRDASIDVQQVDSSITCLNRAPHALLRHMLEVTLMDMYWTVTDNLQDVLL